MINLSEDQKIHIWNCLIFNYISCLIAANNTGNTIIREVFLSLIDLVDDTKYKEYVSNSIPRSFYQLKDNYNITKDIQNIRSKLAKRYPKTPSVTERLKQIQRKSKTDGMTARNPKIWGPTMWAVLHWISLMYTESNSKKIKEGKSNL